MFLLNIFSCSYSTISCSNNSGVIVNEDGSGNSESIINPDNFFPSLFEDDYYDYIDFDNNAKPIINDKFIFKVLEDVVGRVASSLGIITFNVVKYSNSAIDFNFKWEYKDIVLFKTYSFEMGE